VAARAFADGRQHAVASRLAGWAERATGPVVPAVVLGASVNGLSFVRSLGRRGVPTLLLDSERHIGCHTRFAQSAILPSVDTAPEIWTDQLQHLGERLGRPAVVFATSDAHGVYLASQREQLAPLFRFLVPGAETMERIVNKRLQYETARQVGVPIPRTVFPESIAEARIAAVEFSYPCILKPYKSHLGRKRIGAKVVVCQTPDELIGQYAAVAGGEQGFMVQEIVPGDDTALFGYLAFWDERGDERCWLTKQKLRQSSAFGDGAYQVTVDAPQVAAQARLLLRALGYCGFAGVEFRRDPRDGVFRLMEINPRTVSGNQLAIAAGVDFPWVGYRYLTGGGLECCGPFRRGVYFVNEEWDFRAYLGLRRSGNMTFREWAHALLQSEAHAIGAWDDPGPLIALVGRFLRGGLRKLRP
jgi:predicted ATP-grasp superfamily ATP-dependent carboligase